MVESSKAETTQLLVKHISILLKMAAVNLSALEAAVSRLKLHPTLTLSRPIVQAELSRSLTLRMKA